MGDFGAVALSVCFGALLGAGTALWRSDLGLRAAPMAFGAAVLAGAGVAISGAGKMEAAAFAVLAVLALADFYRRILPNELTYALIGYGFVLSYPDVLSACLGAIIGYGSLWMLREIWFRLRGIEALGLGDAKLLAGIGAWCGATALPEIVFWGAIIGLLIGGVSTVLRRPVDDLPFGTALSASLAIYLTAGPVLFPFE